MRKQITCQHLISGILVLLFGCQIGLFAGPDQPEKGHKEAARAETSAPSNAEASAPADPSPAALANEINEMREVIDFHLAQSKTAKLKGRK